MNFDLFFFILCFEFNISNTDALSGLSNEKSLFMHNINEE